MHGDQFTSRRTFTAAGQLEIETYSGGLLDGLAVSNHHNALRQRDGLAVLGVAGAPAVAYGYEDGRLKTVSQGETVVEYEYWPRSGLLSNVVFKSGGVERMRISRRYDGYDRLTAVSNHVAGGPVLSYAYTNNSANQRVAVTNAEGMRWVYQYDPLGQVVSGRRYWGDETPACPVRYYGIVLLCLCVAQREGRAILRRADRRFTAAVRRASARSGAVHKRAFAV